MNREQLSDAIGRLDESILEETMTARRRRRPWWYAAVAVAACVCLAVGMVAAWPQLKPQDVTPSVGNSTHNTNGYPLPWQRRSIRRWRHAPVKMITGRITRHGVPPWPHSASRRRGRRAV